MGRPAMKAGLMIALLLAPREAGAAACCISATSFGVGRLLIWEDFAVGVQIGHARMLGQWDAGGALRWNPDSYSEGLSILQHWAIVRLHERVQVQGWLPLLFNDRRFDGTSQTAGGLGDIGLAVRVEIVKLGAYRGLPSVVLTAGGLTPTGRRVEQTLPPLFAGTTGRGAWSGSLALETEYAFLPWFVRLDTAVAGFLPFDRSDTGQRQQEGVLVQAALSSGREIVPDRLVAALALLFEWQARLHIDGVAVPDSSAHLLSLAASISWRVEPHWTLVGTVTNAVWPSGLGTNRDARIGFIIGVRYGHF